MSLRIPFRKKEDLIAAWHLGLRVGAAASPSQRVRKHAV